MALLDRDDLVRGLRELVDELRARNLGGKVQIIGGAALALRYFDRTSTTDIDARLSIDGDIRAVVEEIGRRHGWGVDWLNDAGAKFIPAYGRAVNWETLADRDGVTIQVASAEALLAMKLRANRQGRDSDDIAELMAICETNTVEAAESVFEAYYPGDALSDRAVAMVEQIILVGLPIAAKAPPAGLR
jgi:hypothetical protein